MNSRYYNYSVNMNGKKIKHGFDYSRDYYPDLIANDSVAFLRQSKHNFARKPVMLVASFPAPHGPEDSAPQFSHLFFNVTTHQWVRQTFWLSILIFCKRDFTPGGGTHAVPKTFLQTGSVSRCCPLDDQRYIRETAYVYTSPIVNGMSFSDWENCK